MSADESSRVPEDDTAKQADNNFQESIYDQFNGIEKDLKQPFDTDAFFARAAGRYNDVLQKLAQ